MRFLSLLLFLALTPVGTVAGPAADEFFRPYASGYAGALAACVQHLEAGGDMGAFAGWEPVEPPEPVCRDGIECQSLSKPVAAWTVVHRGVADDRPLCFGAWTARLVGGSGDVIMALNDLTAVAVDAKRLNRIPPQPDWITGPVFSIAEVYRVNAPPLDNLESYLGCSASATPFVVSLYLHPERLVRFEAQLLDPKRADQWRKDAPCVAIVS